jgi:hypothetical protein
MIIEYIEKIRRHCLWLKKNKEGEEKCNSLAAWDMVCKPKKKGLLLKYLHKFYNKEDTTWVHLLWNNYYFGKIPHAMERYFAS